MSQNKEIPILYAYIHRNMRNGYRTDTIVSTNSLIPLMRRVVHTCPRLIQTEIFKEMEGMGLLRMMGCDRCIILNNKESEKKLKEYAFPIHP